MLKDILEEETAEFYRAGEYLQEKRRTSDKNPDMLNPDYRSQANTIHDIDGKSGTVCAGTMATLLVMYLSQKVQG